MKPLIELRNISVVYNQGQSNETVAIKDVSLDIYEGEYIVFLGPSGSGKSTLLYTIAGLEAATSGQITVATKNLLALPPKEKIEFYRTTIGMVFQAFYLVPHLTAKDNIILPKMFSGASIPEREQKTQELMDRFGISDFYDRKPSMMSGGQQQRTAIARALVNNPLIILADEPVGNLDSKNSSIVLELLDDIHKKEKKTIIQVTHNAADVKYADRVFYMKDGMLERIVVNNENKPEEIHAPEDTEMGKLAVDFPTLSHSELTALVIMRRIFKLYDIDTEHKIRSAIERYVKKEITADELAKVLDSKEGVGLYAQRAKHIAQEVEKTYNEMEIMTAEKPKTFILPENAATDDSRISVIMFYLMSSYAGSLTDEQLHRLRIIIGKRLICDIQKYDLGVFLDKPLSEGGVGLNSRTAKHFTDEVEFMLTKK